MANTEANRVNLFLFMMIEFKLIVVMYNLSVSLTMLQKYRFQSSRSAGVSVCLVGVSVLPVSVPFPSVSVCFWKASLKAGHLRTELANVVPSFMMAKRWRPVQRTVSTCIRFTMAFWWMRQNMPMGRICSK